MRFTLATLGALACAAPVLGEKLVGALGHPYDPNYQRGSISGFELVRSERVVKNGGDVLASAGTAGAATPLVTERATYRSPGMRLAPGEVVFTDPNNTPLKMPAGKVGILSFDAQVVDRNGTPVLLSEVYLHHWLIFDGFGNSGVCGGYLGYKFGVGAESRNTKTAFPEGYALKTTGTERWGANIHMLRTDDVPDVKSCIECHCASGGGNFACCPDGSYCDTKPGIDRAQREYFLEYTVEYIPDPAEHTAVEIFVLDASNCEIEYNVPQCEGPPCVADRSYKATLANDMDLVLALGHLHIGGINVTFLAETPEGKTIDICTSYPTYGTGDKAGDENGYLVAMSPCQYAKSTPAGAPLSLPAGTVLTYTAHYVNDPYRDAVMGLMYVAAVAPNGGHIFAASAPQRWFSHPSFTIVFVAMGCAVAAAIGAAVYVRRRTAAPESSFRPLTEL